jgi:hypothetical protein
MLNLKADYALGNGKRVMGGYEIQNLSYNFEGVEAEAINPITEERQQRQMGFPFTKRF